MSRIYQMIEELRKRSDVCVVDGDQFWRVLISKGRYLFCEVTVPKDVLEWYAAVKHRSKKEEVWSDWMDYSGYDNSPKDKLESEMANDILAFINHVSITYPLSFPLSIDQK